MVYILKNESKINRKLIVNSFSNLLKTEIPGLKKGSGSFWSVDLNRNIYFYVSFEYPKYVEGDNTLSIYSAIQNSYVKPAYNESAQHEKYVEYPFAVHRRLFEFKNVPWYKTNVSYLYWKLLMQKKKIHYYTDEQTQYAVEMLVPVAVQQVVNSYSKFYKKFHGTDSALKDRRI